MAKKRERFEVIKDILQVIRGSRKIKPTRLLYASNLSPQMFKSYIDELLEKRFIQSETDEKGKKLFFITKKGNDFLEQYQIIDNFIKNFGL
ncbi:MAG: hypothetical protein KKA64_03050 [Nanoarchaeota archaeon]|nr:hypothetical protein [Nanoarchaeota archaeon]